MDKVKIMRKMDKDGLLLCDLQGNAFELSIQLTATSSEIFMRRFMNSKVAKMMDNESILQMNILFMIRMLMRVHFLKNGRN